MQQSAAIGQQPGAGVTSSYGNDEKPIQAKGSYQLPELDDFDLQNSNYRYELVDDLSEKQVADADAGLMAKVYGGIKSMLDKAAAKKFKDSTNDFEESKEDSSASLGQERGPSSTEQKKAELRGQLGDKIFDHYYQLIY